MPTSAELIAAVAEHCGAHFDGEPTTVDELCRRIAAAFQANSELRADQEGEINWLRQQLADAYAQRSVPHVIDAPKCALETKGVD